MALHRCRWFCHTDEEREQIWHFFPKFRELQEHIDNAGRVFHGLQPSRTEYAFLCAIVVFATRACRSTSSHSFTFK